MSLYSEAGIFVIPHGVFKVQNSMIQIKKQHKSSPVRGIRGRLLLYVETMDSTNHEDNDYG